MSRESWVTRLADSGQLVARFANRLSTVIATLGRMMKTDMVTNNLDSKASQHKRAVSTALQIASKAYEVFDDG